MQSRFTIYIHRHIYIDSYRREIDEGGFILAVIGIRIKIPMLFLNLFADLSIKLLSDAQWDIHLDYYLKLNWLYY